MIRLRRSNIILTIAGLLAFYHVSTLFTGCGETATGGGDATSEVGIEKPEVIPKPPLMPPASLSGNIPTFVQLDSLNNSPLNARPAFDQFSWQSFIALNWPAKVGVRGEPNNPNDPAVFKEASNTSPVAWDSYKEAWELFGQPDNVRPTVWNSYEADQSPCNTDANTKSLQMMSKVGTVFGDIDEALSYPLIDQNNEYVYFDVRFNRVQYDFIRGKDNEDNSWLYLSKNLITGRGNFPVDMPESTQDTLGALMLKGAWKQLNQAEIEGKKFYTAPAKIYDQLVDSCRTVTLGLVGLHIAQKLDSFQQWIWSTFEHIDNVPEPGDQTGKKYSFNNGTNNPPSPNGYAEADKPESFDAVTASERKPVQVSRYNKIPTTPKGSSTAEINAYYQNEIVKGTVWENYQLVFTQWPTMHNQFRYDDQIGASYPKYSGQPFPADSVTNSVIETYMQAQEDAGALGNSCMACHYRGASTYDYSWVLKRRAH